jgi:hypothetical protein
VAGLPPEVLARARETAWIVTDHNGEAYRALDWGHALVRLGAIAPGFRSAPLLYPALSFGDTGAASGGVACCLVVEALARRWAPADAALVLSAADGPERTAVALGRC